MMRNHTAIAMAVCLGALALPAHADIMHWFWEVDVNGQAVDATRPIEVGAGDQVDIELWAEFDPYRDGFAIAEFAITTSDHFFEHGNVSIDYAEGYGLNPLLTLFGQNGDFVDSNGDGHDDIIDDIVAYQLHPDWGSAFDTSDPIRVYSIGWAVTTALDTVVTLGHAQQLSGRFHSAVWVGPYDAVEYPVQSDVMVFVPSPQPTCLIVLACVTGLRRHRVSVARRH